MKKSLLNSIAKNSFLTNLFAFTGILSILGMLILPFFGFVLLAFLSTILICVSFVLMAQFEASLENDLKEAKNQLGLSIFTDNNELLKKCLQVQKSLKNF